MVYIDWNKVAEDYRNSSLDWEYLDDYAKKAAETLVSREIPFDGYTDDRMPSNSLKGVFYKWCNTLTGLSKEHMKLEYLHIGYWKLETCQWEMHEGRRYMEEFWDKRGSYYYQRQGNGLLVG